MALKLLQITAPISAENNIRKMAASEGVLSFTRGTDVEDDHAMFFLLTSAENRQQTIDKLHSLVKTSAQARINILPVDATLPAPGGIQGQSDTREELYPKLVSSVHMDLTYLMLAAFSTIVALVGLIQDNIAVVIGAMVIAPFLGPNLAFAFGTSLGDRGLMRKAFLTGITGVSVAVLMSMFVGVIWGYIPDSAELMARTDVDLSGVALAAASGVAGVLSLTSGLSMTLVGVMVAVALLPPAATFGFMLGAGELRLAYGAMLLLSVNIVCVNLSGLVVFLAKGIKPRLWFERRMAKPYVLWAIAFWSAALIGLMWVMGTNPMAALYYILNQLELTLLS